MAGQQAADLVRDFLRVAVLERRAHQHGQGGENFPVGPALAQRLDRVPHRLHVAFRVREGAVLLGVGAGREHDMRQRCRLGEEQLLALHGVHREPVEPAGPDAEHDRQRPDEQRPLVHLRGHERAEPGVRVEAPGVQAGHEKLRRLGRERREPLDQQELVDVQLLARRDQRLREVLGRKEDHGGGEREHQQWPGGDRTGTEQDQPVEPGGPQAQQRRREIGGALRVRWRSYRDEKGVGGVEGRRDRAAEVQPSAAPVATDEVAEAGLEDDTRVVYTSDHGDNLGARGLWGKSTMYEEIAGVPFLLAGPGIAKGRVIDTPVSHVDAFPTLMEIAGETMPAGFPGVSLTRISEGFKPERTVLSEYHGMGSSTGAFAVRVGKWKYVHYAKYGPQLFDLENDPEETQDLAQSPRHAKVLEQCRAALYAICDPQEVDRRARKRQAELIAANGGREAVIQRGDFGFTPAPGTVADFK